MTMPVMTRDALVDTFKARRGAFPMTIVAETAPDMRKTDNPYVGALKVARVNGMGGSWNYENGVNRLLDKEGKPMDFTAFPRKWGQRVLHDDGRLTGLVHHVNKEGVERWYVEMRVLRSLQHEYRFNGAVVDSGLIHPFLRQKEEGTRQGLDNPLILRDYAVDNIRQVTMDGIVYDVE
jgi:hypothetical protein